MDVVKTEHHTSTAGTEDKPRLLFFYSPTNGRDRRLEGFLAQVLHALSDPRAAQSSRSS